MYGDSTEFSELEFEAAICRNLGWGVTADDKKCVLYTNFRAHHSPRVPCLYWSWLKTKTPVGGDIVVQNVTRSTQPPYSTFLTVLMGDTTVLFEEEPLRPEQEDRPRPLYVRSIDGVSVWDLRQKDFSDMDSMLRRMGLDNEGYWPDEKSVSEIR